MIPAVDSTSLIRIWLRALHFEDSLQPGKHNQKSGYFTTVLVQAVTRQL